MRCLVAASRKNIILFSIFFLQQSIAAFAQNNNNTNNVITLFGNQIDVKLSAVYSIGPEIIFGDETSEDLTLSPSVFAEFQSSFRLNKYKNWILNASVVVLDDNSQFVINDDFDQYEDLFGSLLFDISELTFEYRGQKSRTFTGIFSPNFGTPRRDLGIGLFGTDLIAYDLFNKIGLGGEFLLSNGPSGKHTVSAAVFDDVELNPLDSFDGAFEGVADGAFGVAAALDGTLPNVGNSFRYHLAASSEDLSNGRSTGLVASIGQTGYPLTKDLQMRWLGELAYITNFQDTGDDIAFFTLGGILNWKQFITSATYSVAAAYDEENFDIDNLFANSDSLFAASAGYNFGAYGTLSLAYRYRELQGDPENTFALIYSNFHSYNLGQRIE